MTSATTATSSRWTSASLSGSEGDNGLDRKYRSEKFISTLKTAVFEAASRESSFTAVIPKAPDSPFFLIVIRRGTVYNGIER
jgi:hypothetical protein